MPRGGFRAGAGRKINSGIYREKTIARRIPVSLTAAVDSFLADHKSLVHNSVAASGVKEEDYSDRLSCAVKLPLFASRVAAGFPSPADDFLESSINLNQHLILHPASTFLVRASGHSMIGAGIHDNDILLVDRSLEARNDDIVIAVVNAELTVKRLAIAKNQVRLMPENPDYQPLVIDQETDFTVWGVVTTVIHQFRNKS
jgi:DNA polymerase V